MYHLGPQLLPFEGKEGDNTDGGIINPGLPTNCPNSNFNEGTFHYWEGCYGHFSNSCEIEGFLLSQEPPQYTRPLHKIIHGPGWYDSNTCDSLRTVFPGEAYSCRIGDTTYTGGTGKAAEVKYAVTVSSDSYLFIYRYAVVLQNGGHPANQQPDFKVEVTDASGTLLDTCGYYYICAPPSGQIWPGWHSCVNDISWKEWTTVGMNLTPYLGQTVYIHFKARGCWYNTHFGCAYLSTYCAFLTMQTAMCEGDTSATLTAPPGFTYLWSTLNGDPSVNGVTSQTVVVPHPTTGSTYTCTLTAPNGCQVAISQTLTYTVIHANFSYSSGLASNSACSGIPVQFIDSSYVNQNSVVNWKWDFDDGTPKVIGNSNPLHTFPNPGIYNVKLVAYSTEGCMDSIIRVIHVDSLPFVTNNPKRKTICSKSSTNLPLQSNVTGTTFTWQSLSFNPLLTGNSQNPATPSTSINDILVNNDVTKDSIEYMITPKKSSCQGPDSIIWVTVQPLPKLMNASLLKSICDSANTSVTLQKNFDSVKFTWTCTASSPNVSGYANNTTTPSTTISQVLYTTGILPDTVYYTITPHAFGCDGDSMIFKVAVYPKPLLTNTPRRVILCNGDPLNVNLQSNVGSTTFTWNYTAGANITGATNSGGPTTLLNQSLLNMSTADDSVTYHITPAAYGCNGPVTDYKVIIHPLPVPLITGTNSVCVNDIKTYSVQAGMSNYAWTIAGGTITAGNGTNQVTVQWTTAGSQNLTSTFTDAIGCNPASPKSFAVTVHALPVPSILGIDSLCLNTTATYSTDAAMNLYDWNLVSGGTIVSGNGTNTVSVHWTATGTHILQVTYTDTYGCNPVTPTSRNIKVFPLPAPTITGPVSACFNSTQFYTTEAGKNTYLWSVTGGTITGGTGTNTVQITWTSVGAGTVSVNYTDNKGCTAGSPTIYNVTVNALPVPVVTGPTAVCSGLTATYSTTAGMTGYTWALSAGGTITAGAGTNSITVLWTSTGGPETVSLNYTDGNGCTAASSTIKNITINPLPGPTVAGNASVCNNTTQTYTTEAGKSGYAWAVSAGGAITSGSTTNAITVSWTVAGTQTVSVNYTDGNTCTAVNPTIYNVTVHALPVPSIAGPGAMCLNTSGSYSTETGMTGYTWTVTGGTITGGSGTNTVTVDWTSTGTQTLTVNYTDGNGCTAGTATSYTVQVNTLPVPTITGPAGVCSGLTGVYSTEGGMSGYTWTPSGGGTVIAGTGTSTVTVQWNTVGAQTLSVNYTVGTGCTAPLPTLKNITVFALPAPTITGNNVVCQNTTQTYSTEAGMTGYLWTVPAAGTIQSGAGTNSITVLWNSPGSHVISVNYTNGNSCTAVTATPATITVNPAPVPSITGNNATCVFNTYSYTTEAGMTNYTWTITGGTILSGAGTGTINVRWTSTGTQTLTVTYTDANSCNPLAATSRSITVNPLPAPAVTGSNSVCSLQANVAYSTPNVIGHTYAWSLTGGAFTSSPNANNVTVTWGAPGTGTLKVIETIQATGCRDSASYNITINPLPAPVISGPGSVCELSTQVYTSPSFAGHSYNWTVTGGTIQSGQGTSSITVLWGGTGTGTIAMTETILATTCSAMATNLSVTLSPYPVAAGAITGPASVCENTPALTYSIPAILYASSYVWSYSGTGVTIINSGNTITASFAMGATSGTLSVHGLNGCGTGPSSSISIAIHPVPIMAYTPCNDPVTMTTAQPFTLKGATPLGGTFSGTGVNTNIFYPALAGPGGHTISYTYTNTWTCTSNLTFTITVMAAPAFACGNTLTDIRDNAVYPTVAIGVQCWMASNLIYGSTIPSTSVQRDNCTPERYCFGDNSANCTSQGGLYQWDELMQYTAAAGAQGLCPPGWHVPTENDWMILVGNFAGLGFAGDPIKTTGYTGFSANFWGLGHKNTTWDWPTWVTMFWTSLSDGPGKAWAHGINSMDPSMSSYPGARSNAFPVRCLKD
jgi:uncharacterized protein (TIGR02145 family)